MSLNLQKWSPHPYQVKAVNFLINNYSAALFLDPGLGKTSITLQAIKFLKEHGALNKVLLIAPLRICYSVWPAEIAKWSNFSDLRISVVHGPGRQAALEADADIYILNPEGLAWLLDARRRRLFLEKKFDDSFLKQMPNANATAFDYKNILKLLDKSFKEIQSKQRNSKFNDIYEDLTLKDLEGIIAQVPLIKSTKLINLLVLSLISKELYSPIFEEMEEDMFVKYLKVAIQSNVKEEKHLFENLTIKALEKYRK